ncbi:hypothetical protein Riv7116_6520 [Rivularia sp. PCC 7116]|nr:hypothetical protein Riv7116_6520 [Rivularia sp. PCC 7116]
MSKLFYLPTLITVYKNILLGTEPDETAAKMIKLINE